MGAMGAIVALDTMSHHVIEIEDPKKENE